MNVEASEEQQSGALVPYQRAWLADDSRKKVMVKGRRLGGSHIIALESAARAAGVDLVRRIRCKPAPQIILSASDLQARKLYKRVLHCIRGFELMLGPLIKDDPLERSCTLQSGVTVEAFSTNPNTVRGDGGDVVLDEWASAPNQDALWAAVQPMANKSLGAPDGYRIRVCSTPLGDQNHFYRIAAGDHSQAWSVHSIDLPTAISQGFPMSTGEYEALRADEDEDLFAQEYLCSFIAGSTRYISAEIYDAAVYYDDDPAVDPSRTTIAGSSFYGGIDVARKRDLTSLCKLRKDVSGIAWHTETYVSRGASWDEQEAWVDQRARGCSRIAVDASGLGSQFAERLANRFPGRIDELTFTLQLKEELATGLKLALQRKRLRPRADDSATRREVLSMKKVITEAGNTRFDIERDKRGHGDRAWAMALALRATGTATRTTRAPARVLSEVERYVRDRYGMDRTRPWRQLRAPRGSYQ